MQRQKVLATTGIIIRTLLIINRENCVRNNCEYITYGSGNARMTVGRTRPIINHNIDTMLGR